MRHEEQVRWVARAGWVAALLLVAALASSALGPPSILDDTDGDGMPDVVELVRGTDPADPDSDADGAFDGDEASRIRSHTRLEEKPFGEPGISRPVDLDGDGDIDILQLRTSFSPDQLSWYENRLAEPAGDFARREIEELSVSSSRAVVAADLDGDGDPDVVTTSTLGPGWIGWYENRLDEEAADFGPRDTLSAFLPDDGPDVVLAADLDGDGDPELVVWFNSAVDEVWYYENRLDEPSADFARPEPIAESLIGRPPGAENPFSAADVDGDGDLDLFTSSDQLEWYENRLDEAAGDFADPELFGVRDERGFDYGMVDAVDFDADGDPDALSFLSAYTEEGSVFWYENLRPAEAGFSGRNPIASALPGIESVSAADLDGDGDFDLLIAIPSDGSGWVENVGDATAPAFGPFVPLPIQWVFEGQTLAAELDGDGNPDILQGGVWYPNPATDPLDPDSDGDGLPDGVETGSGIFIDEGDTGTDPKAPDTDGDGLTDGVETNSGVVAGPDDTGTDPLAADTDGDGLPDPYEIDHGFDPFATDDGILDPDLDGLDNLGERARGTDPRLPDTDFDGLLDLSETGTGLWVDAADTGSDPLEPDSDDDGLLDGFETNTGLYLGPTDTGTDPNVADGDNDGALDGVETNTGSDVGPLDRGTDPFDPDSDDDGLLDGFETNTGVLVDERDTGTDPHDPDGDGDGLTDGFEVEHGFDPFTPGEQAGDPDADGIDNLAEQAMGTDPRDPDTDDDGLVDGVETATGVFVDASDTGTDPVRPDSDGDGLRDGFEVENGFDPHQPGEASGDPDEDGFDNWGEQAAGTNPFLADTDGDGLTDWQEVGRIHNRPVVSQLERFAIRYDDCDAISAADIDGDGDPDIFCGSKDGYQAYPEQDGYASWWENGADASDDAHLISDWYTESVATADFDGDGDPDLVAAGLSSLRTLAVRVWWQENQREGGAVEFGPEQVLDDRPGWPVGSVFAADVDGDGDPDIVQRAWNEILWYENRLELASHDFAPPVAISRPGEGAEVTAIFPADLDADGDADLLAASHVDRSIYWYESLASPSGTTFSPRRLVGSHPGTVFYVLAADLDSDADPDVVWSPDGILWYSNVPSGLGVGFVSQGIVIQNASSPAVADLDRDGHLDLIARVDRGPRVDRGTHWWRNRLPITFVDKGKLTASAVSLFADMDGDGDEDLVTLPYSGLDWLRNPGLDPNDPDTDGDGLLDGVETETGVYEGPADTGTDPHEADSDGDGLPDGVETATGVFGGPLDTGSDPHDADTDGDGLLDGFEVGSGLDLFVPDATGDPDGDFVDNTAEQAAGTRANDPDTDGDGLRDGFEIRAGFDPLVPGEASLDPDGDGVVNLDEQRLGSDPNVVDTDVDGLPDGVETATGVYLGPLDTGTYPTRFDSDDDGLRDGFENRSGLFEAPYATGSDPHLPDSDGDGLEDGFEVQGGMDPTTPGEAGLDPDGDTLSNLDEQARGTDPLDPDSDGDGLLDPVETLTGIYVGPSDTGTDPRSADSDGDRLRDGFEVVHGFDPNAPDDASLDPDADGLSHLGEQRAGADPFRADTDGDGESDGQEVTRIRGMAPVEHALGFACEWVDLADLDGDSDADVLCAAEGSLTWHANRLAEPSGDIAPGALIATPAPASPRVASADLDGDGDMDVVSNFAGEVVWFENRLDEPAGSIGPERRIALAFQPTDLAFDDRDGDGDIDVLIRSRPMPPAGSVGRVDWHPNRLHESEGDFGAAEVVSTLTRGPLLLSDLDHDADRDLVSRTQPLSATEGVWFETLRFHTGTFSSPGQVLPGADSSVFAVAVGDFDGDEADDVVWGGGLAASWNRNLSGPSAIAFSGPTPLASSAQLLEVATEDLDSDGDADVFAQLSMEGIVWWQNAEAGPERFPDPSAPLSPRTGALGLLAEDLDGDGDPDIVAWFPDEVVWLENPGTSAVPEPGASALGVAALWVLARLRRSKRPLSWAHE